MDGKRLEKRRSMRKMSDDFKRKLESYENGHLKGEELAEFEKELAKLEYYQDHLEEKEPKQRRPINEGKQHKILSRSKWKARFQTAMTALGIIFIFMVVSTILTGIYYSAGDPDRVEELASVVDHTLTVTDPYGYMGSTSSNGKFFFRMDMTRDINKKIGKEGIQVGELHIPFFFSLMGLPEKDVGVSRNQPIFIYPERVADWEAWESDWDRLEHLPEGTVVSAYVSFKELLETSEVFQEFSAKKMDIIWLAVDTGVGGADDDYVGVNNYPVGFPYHPIWHEDDMIQSPETVEKGFLFSKIITSGSQSPDYEVGDTDILHKQFLKTLHFLEKHEKKAENIYDGWELNLEERLGFLDENGIKHYGIVVTGPTKEILKLQDEERVSYLEIDEVGFWNWWDE